MSSVRAGDGLMEYIPSIAGTATTAAKLDVLDFQLSSTLTGETGSLHASLRIGGMFNLNGNDGGVLVMEFPDGFEFVADPMPAIVVTSPTRGVFQLLGAGAPGCPMTNCPGERSKPIDSGCFPQALEVCTPHIYARHTVPMLAARAWCFLPWCALCRVLS
eukprot:2920702-Rhodomonas_salina.9